MREPSRFYEFGAFRFDLGSSVLLRDGEPQPLGPKACDTLRVLLEQAGHVVTKSELMERVWPDCHVEENNLAQSISALRKALGTRSDGRPYIETVPRRGYRFVPARNVRSGEFLPMGQVAWPGAETPSPLILPKAPPVHYARSGEVNIAYQVVGDGPIDLVFVMGWISHLEYFWAEPTFARFLERLSSFSRLILFDKRGTGLSDRVPVHQLPTLEQRMDDVRAVMDAVGSQRAALCGVSEGGPMCTLFSATYPEKTSALVMIGSYAKRIWDPEYPWAPTIEQRQKFFEVMQAQWGGPVGIAERAPSRADDPEFREWWAAYLRMGASPGAAVALTKMNAEIDVRPILPSIRVPTLVIHRTGDACLKVEEGRYLADRIPGARFVELPGRDHLPFVGDQEAILAEIEDFLAGVQQGLDGNRLLSTVLFASIDGEGGPVSPEARESLDRQATVEVDRFRGRRSGRIGEGPLATFDGPARAIRCGSAIRDYGRQLGISVSAGVHTGECDVAGDSVHGIAVDVGREVTAAARNGEVLVSGTVKDLVAGSGISFREHARMELRGVPGVWQLYAVE